MLEQLGSPHVVLFVPPANTARSRSAGQALASLRCSLGDGAVVERCVNASCITPDSCGKAGDPHNLESLAACPGHIATKRRRALDEDVAAQEAGDSQARPVSLG